MGVTVEELLRLPSLSIAKVLGGHRGLQKTVTSISVLEYTDPSDLQEQFFGQEEFRTGEIVISGFISIKDRIEDQCRVLRRLHQAGEAGLIIYYVGIFVPRIDKQLIALADELGFPLICMPENRMDLQYGTAIYEVTEEIIKEQMTDTYLVGEILEKVAFLPSYQRSMDYLLGLVSTRICASLLLLDEKFRLINCAYVHKESQDLFGAFSAYFENNVEKLPLEPRKIYLDREQYMCCQKVKTGNQAPLYLVIIRENNPVPRGLCWQASEVVQLFIRIWSQGHGDVGRDEMLNAILKDEQVKLQRLAESMQMDVNAIHHMILVLPSNLQRNVPVEVWNRIIDKTKDLLENNYLLSLSGIFDNYLTIFTGEENIAGSYQQITDAFMEELHADKEDWVLVMCRGLSNIKEVRRAFIDCKNYIKDARVIFPLKNPLTYQEIQFAGKCRKIINSGEDSLDLGFKPLKELGERGDSDLYKTLETYFLDADMSIVKTAELLYLHKNTIKYRITKLTDIFHYRINKMPEAYELYKAVAVHRLQTNYFDHR